MRVMKIGESWATSKESCSFDTSRSGNCPLNRLVDELLASRCFPEAGFSVEMVDQPTNRSADKETHMSTLKEKLEEHKKQFLTKVNDEILAIVGAAGGALAETVPNRKTPKAGDKLPAFSLIGSAGGTVASDELLANGPLVVTFFRGMW